MRVSFDRIFTVFPAILFGPIYGAIVGGLSDFLGWVFKPQGAYIPWLTLTAMLGGFLQGLIWKLIRKKKNEPLKIVVVLIFAIVGILGIINHLALNSDKLIQGFYAIQSTTVTKDVATQMLGKGELSPISSLVVSLAQYTSAEAYQAKLALYCNMLTIGLEALSLICLVILVLDKLIKDTGKIKKSGYFLKFIVTMIITGITITTLNTQILKIYLPALADRAFVLFWIPRLIEEIISCSIQAYIVSLLFTVYINRIAPKEI